MATPNSRISTLESSKQDVHQFILQKKACLPKCTLQQLKEAIVEGHYPSLKKRSGLDREHLIEDGCLVFNIDPNAAAGRLVRNTDGVDIQAPRFYLAHLLPEGENAMQVNAYANLSNSANNEIAKQKDVQPLDGKQKCFDDSRSLEHSTNSGAYPMNEIPNLVAAQNINEAMLEDPPDVIVVSRKRKSSACTKEQQVGCSDGGELRTDVKKPGCNELKSMGQKIDFLVATEGLLDGPHLRISDEERVSAAEKCNQDSQTADWMENSLCIKCNRGGPLLICCVNNCPIVVHESCLGSSACFDDTGNFCCPYCSLSHATAAYKETNKKLSLAKEKVALARNHFLKFVHLVNTHQQRQPSEILPKEISSKSRIGENANFINEIRHHQEAEVAAGCSNALNRGAPSVSISERNDADLTKAGFQRIQANSNQDSRLVENQELLRPYSIQCGDDLPQREGTTIFCTSDVSLSKGNSESIMIREGRKQAAAEHCDAGNSHHVGTEAAVESENADIQQQSVKSSKGPSSAVNVNAGEVSVSSPCGNMQAVSNSRECTDIGTETAVLQQQNINSIEKPPSQLNVNGVEISSKPPCVDTEAVSNSQEHFDAELQNEVLQQETVNSQGSSSQPNVNAPEISANSPNLDTTLNSKLRVDRMKGKAVLQQQPVNSPQGSSDVDAAETSETEVNGCVSFEFKRRKLPAMQVQEFPSSRRKKTPWSSEEEEMLKVGVEKFASTDHKNIPWKKILEFGRHVFLESRNPTDLKDKWRRL